MSANIYTIESLLVGQEYRSRTLTGKIVRAEKDERAVWYGENTESFIVEIRPEIGMKNQYRTLAVKVKD